jgi:TRAP-type C4-dicarboxylate transport system substrate-binding protein
MKGSKIIALVMLAAVCSWVWGCAGTTPTTAPEKKTTIRWASPFKPGHTLVETGNKFKEIVEKGSGGRLAVEVQAGVGSEEEINDWCSQGKVEMQATGGRPLEVSAPQYFFFNAPYVMKDFDHFMRVCGESSASRRVSGSRRTATRNISASFTAGCGRPLPGSRFIHRPTFIC